MSIFGSIIGKIFGGSSEKSAPAAAPATPDAPAAPAEAPAAPVASAAPAAEAAAVPVEAPPAAPAAPAEAPAVSADVAAPVDIAKILDDLNEANPETLDWRVSTVDLLKVLGLESSLEARKQLAANLKYDGDESDSVVLNVWLHQKIIDLVAANGGKVPADLFTK
jgi:pyruvate/2-oxoglutarate dehydrogenase complex dihydrolipoamide acyltransferase (E2) component